MKRFMVIETFFPECKDKVYDRFHKEGRMLPDGLYYIDSWLEKDGDRGFQIMETADDSLFDLWAKNWSDLGEFEVVELGDKPGPVDA